MDINKITEIFSAWRISFNPNDDQSDLASKRIEICNGCEHKEMISIGEFDIFARCNLCGCALKAKIFTNHTYKDVGGTCPMMKWLTVEDEYLNSKDNG